MAIDRHVIEQDIPEPALPLEKPDAVGPLVKPGLSRGEDGVSAVLVRQHLKGNGLHALPRFRENHLRLSVIHRSKDARTVTGQQEDAREHQRGNVLKALPINDLPLKPRTLCRVQAGPRGDTSRSGQPRHQKRRGNGLAAEPQQRNQAMHQRRDKIHIRRRQTVVDQRTGFFCSGISGSPPFGGCITSAMRILSTQEPSAFPADFWAIHKADLP